MKFKAILLSLLCSLDYAEDDEKNTFGKNVKGKYRPRSDFRFDLRMKCLANDAVSTGYTLSRVTWGRWELRQFSVLVSMLNGSSYILCIKRII